MSTSTFGVELLGLFSSRFGRTRCLSGVEVGDSWLRVARRQKRRDKDEWVLADLYLDTIDTPSAQETGESETQDSQLPQGSANAPHGRPAQQPLREQAARAGIVRGPVICAVNSPGIDIFPLSLRPRESVSIDQQVVDMAGQYLGDQMSHSVLDYAVLPESVVRPGDDVVAVLVFAVARSLVERILDTLASIGLEARHLLTPACVLAPRISQEAVGARNLVFATAADTTSVSVVQDGHVLMERILSWGFDGLVEHLQAELGLDEAQSRMLLIRDGGTRGDVAADSRMNALYQIIEPDLQELVHEASGCLRYCDSFLRPASIATAVITGPLASNQLVRDFLERALEVPVQEPAQIMDLPQPTGGGEGEAFTTAVSCALWDEQDTS